MNKLEKLKQDILQRLSSFPVQSEIYTSLHFLNASHGSLYDCDTDEARYETSQFLHKPWNVVTPEHWHEHFWATSFFTPEAYRYYLPSIIKCYLNDENMVEMAISDLYSSIREMYKIITNHLKDRMSLWEINRWVGFNRLQINCILLFFLYLERRMKPYYTVEIQQALIVCSYLKNKCKEDIST